MPKNTRRVIAGTVAGITLGAVAAPASASAAPRENAVQAAADRLVADGQPGVIVMTRRGDRVSHVTSGVADKATGRAMDHRLRLRIASVTKTFTATVMLQLVADRGYGISLDDTVDRWLPEVVRANGNDGTAITIRHLLQHTSGLNEYVLAPRVLNDPRRTWKPRELVDLALERRPIDAPGATWHYANTNYILAGMIIERVTGHSLGSEFRSRIVRPLGLRHTTLPIADRGFPAPYVHGYFGDLGDVSTEISPSSGWASGGIISTVDDVATFHRALFTGRMLPKAQQRELTRTREVNDDGQVEDYGLGVYRVQLSCGYAWGHDGGFPGYRTWTYTSANGRRQAVLTYNLSSLDTPKFRADRAGAADAAFCA
ncbi:serine hydrolase domain-containing protein [Spirillospora sp. CA-294931]|uniref:serine hydrolase domain-containing protein n=1 Tax=Spirillospora sp. CA-294931 TaxID=3240042 RepID=UPI003D8DADAD